MTIFILEGVCMKTKKISFKAITLLFISVIAVLCFELLFRTTSIIAEASDDSSITKMPDNAINFSFERDQFRTISAPENGGLYYFNNNSISFYDVENNEVSVLANFKNVNDVYADESRFYILRYVFADSKYTFYIDTYNALTETLESSKDITSFIDYNYYLGACAIGVDHDGRFYLVTYDSTKEENKYTIHLISSDFKELSSIDVDYRIYRFNGFDKTNGNFYFEGFYNWIYWGYDHSTNSLKAGNVTNNEITLCENTVAVLYQLGYSAHYDSAVMNNE